MSFSTQEARDAIYQPLMDAWVAQSLDTSLIYFPDRPGETPASVPIWARATLRHDDGRQASLTGAINGLKRLRSTGVLTIQVFCPVGQGSNPAYDAAEVIRDAYFKAQHPKVWFRRVRLIEIGSRGAYDQINVLANFTYDLQR